MENMRNILFSNRSFLHYNTSSGRLALHLFSGLPLPVIRAEMYQNLGLAMVTISILFLVFFFLAVPK